MFWTSSTPSSTSSSSSSLLFLQLTTTRNRISSSYRKPYHRHNNNNHRTRRKHNPNNYEQVFPTRRRNEFVGEDKDEDNWQSHVLCLVMLTVLSLCVYWNSLDGDFVHDDVVSIVRNPDVRPHQGWWTMWLNDYWGMPMSSQMSHKSYRPLTVLTFRINFWLGGGLSPMLFHATNILIHILVVLLLFQLTHQVFNIRILPAFTASAIFALHPIHTEAVAGITGRSDPLACLLMLLSFLFYSKSIQSQSEAEEEEEGGGGGQQQKTGLNIGILASGICGCVAMLAKETGITVMGINILYDVYLHAHLVKRWVTAKGEDHEQVKLRRRMTFMMALISVSLGTRIALMNGSFPRFSPQDNPAAYAKDLTRFLTHMYLPVFNVWLMICPYRLSYDWQMGSIPLVESIWDVRNLCSVMFYSFYFLLLTTSLDKGRRRKYKDGPILFVSLLFITLPFLPASNLFFPVGFVAAERILYTPSVGLCILISCGIARIHHFLGTKWLKKSFVLGVCFVLMSFSIKTWDRNFVWKSRASLFESGVRENPWNAKVHYNYANLQKDLGNIEMAVKHYKIAIRLWPTYASAYNNLGALSEDLSVAEDSFLRAIDANPQHNGAHFNLGVIYMRSEKYQEALQHLEECFKIDPSHVEALQYLGACYNVLNKSDEAENVFLKLISSDLPPSKLHTNFGVFLEELGLTSKALTHFLLALTKTSWDVQALVHAAKLAYQLGAEQLFYELSERLLSMKFDPSVGYMLATSYMEQGKLLDAKVLFEKLFSQEADSFYKIRYTQLLMKVRRWSDAEWAIEGIGSNDPNYPISIILLAQIYENLNKTMEGVDLLNCGIDNFCPQDANLCSQFYSQLGNLMHTMGAFHSAANYYDMAIKFNPTSVQAHTNIGAIYHLMSDYKQAESHYLAALAIEPKNQIVLSNMRKLERAQNNVVTIIPMTHNQHQNNNRPHQPVPFGGPFHHNPLHHHSHTKFHFSWR